MTEGAGDSISIETSKVSLLVQHNGSMGSMALFWKTEAAGFVSY